MFGKDGIDILQQVQMSCLGNFWFVGDLEDCELGRAGKPSINSTRAIKYGNLLSIETIQSSRRLLLHSNWVSLSWEISTRDYIISWHKKNHLSSLMIAESISFRVFQHYGMPVTWGYVINAVIKEPGLMKFNLLETLIAKQSIHYLVLAFLSSKVF